MAVTLVTVLDQQRTAWKQFVASVDGDRQHVKQLIEAVAADARLDSAELTKGLYAMKFPRRRDLFEATQLTLLQSTSGLSMAH